MEEIYIQHVDAYREKKLTGENEEQKRENGKHTLQAIS